MDNDPTPNLANQLACAHCGGTRGAIPRLVYDEGLISVCCTAPYRQVEYSLDGWSRRHVNLTLYDLTTAEAYRLLSATQRITRSHRLRAMNMYLVHTPRNGGQPPGPTHDPAFAGHVVEAAIDYREHTEKAPTLDVLPSLLGVSRTSYTDWLKRSRLTSTDIKLISSSRTISDGMALLTSLQRKRREQRI
jgi:hypothetical protein